MAPASTFRDGEEAAGVYRSGRACNGRGGKSKGMAKVVG